jgi:hypothetical protein
MMTNKKNIDYTKAFNIILGVTLTGLEETYAHRIGVTFLTPVIEIIEPKFQGKKKLTCEDQTLLRLSFRLESSIISSDPLVTTEIAIISQNLKNRYEHLLTQKI